MKMVIKIILIVLGVIVIIGAGGFTYLCIGLNLKNAPVKDVDISKVADGTYTGKLNKARFSNKLEVTVSGGKITDIKIVKDMNIVLPNVSSQIFDKVKEKQSLQVDCVSQATVSSKAYLKSLEDALSLRS